MLRYISVRSGLAALSSFLFVLILGPYFIRFIQRRQFGQAVRLDGPQSHLKKEGVPTMGGFLILGGAIFGSLLWMDWSNFYLWAVIGLTMSYCLIGGYDDYLKVVRRDPEGLSSRWKFRAQYIFALVFMVAMYRYEASNTELAGEVYFPFFKNLILHLGPWTIPFGVFVLVANSNAVNLTDGLDGLAIGPCIVCFAAFFLLCYLGGHVNFAKYLQIPYVPKLGELTIFCASVFAAGIGFLWFNTYPAQIFMGDVGSLSLGGAIAALAIASKNEILLLILGGVFVVEALSVIMQVMSFKLTGKRIFKMAPLHHHFELMGWAEPKVIVRFWIISYVFAVLALGSLKLR